MRRRGCGRGAREAAAATRAADRALRRIFHARACCGRDSRVTGLLLLRARRMGLAAVVVVVLILRYGFAGSDRRARTPCRRRRQPRRRKSSSPGRAAARRDAGRGKRAGDADGLRGSQCPFCRDWALGTLPSVVADSCGPRRPSSSTAASRSWVQLTGWVGRSTPPVSRTSSGTRQRALSPPGHGEHRLDHRRRDQRGRCERRRESRRDQGGGTHSCRQRRPGRGCHRAKCRPRPGHADLRPAAPALAAAAAERDRARPGHLRIGARGRPAVSLRRAIAVAALAGIAAPRT